MSTPHVNIIISPCGGRFRLQCLSSYVPSIFRCVSSKPPACTEQVCNKRGQGQNGGKGSFLMPSPEKPPGYIIEAGLRIHNLRRRSELAVGPDILEMQRTYSSRAYQVYRRRTNPSSYIHDELDEIDATTEDIPTHPSALLVLEQGIACTPYIHTVQGALWNICHIPLQYRWVCTGRYRQVVCVLLRETRLIDIYTCRINRYGDRPLYQKVDQLLMQIVGMLALLYFDILELCGTTERVCPTT